MNKKKQRVISSTLKTVFAILGLVWFSCIRAQFPEMIRVKGGAFLMGNNYPGTPHEVILSDFSIAKTETTVEQYRAFCDETKRSMPVPPTSGWNDNAPIANVSWYDAGAYIKWLNFKTGKKYRLPTEAEWEYAARGGNQSKGYPYSGANDMDSVTVYTDNNYHSIGSVGQMPANELGLYDMTGSVWEWCADWFVSNFLDTNVNPKGPDSGTYRVIRGGCWFFTELSCRTVYRNYYDPSYKTLYNGFRVALSE